MVVKPELWDISLYPERLIARLVIEKYPMSALGDIKDIAKLASVGPPTTSPLDTLVPVIAATDAQLARLVGQLGETAGKRMVMLEQLPSAARVPGQDAPDRGSCSGGRGGRASLHAHRKFLARSDFHHPNRLSFC